MCTQLRHGSRILLMCCLLLQGSKMCRARVQRAYVTARSTICPTILTMPSPRCCYDGAAIHASRHPRLATAQQLADAATWRQQRGGAPAAHALHICNTHRLQPPTLPPAAEVRRKKTSRQRTDALKHTRVDCSHAHLQCLFASACR